MILQVLIAIVAGWINRHQQHIIAYLKEENRVLKSKLPGGHLRLTDTERRGLATLAHLLSRKQIKDTATIATPDTLMRWYKQLIANKFDGSKKRNGPGRPRVDEEIEQLVIRMATENPTWGIAISKAPWQTWATTSTRSPYATFCAVSTSIPLRNAVSRA